MIQLTKTVKDGPSYDKIDGLTYCLSRGKKYGTVMIYTVIVVFVEVYMKNLESVV